MISIDPALAVADHCILVYMYSDSSEKLQKSYWGDGERGAGRRLLKYVIDNKNNDEAVVITH